MEAGTDVVEMATLCVNAATEFPDHGIFGKIDLPRENAFQKIF